jgi:hypothetical protein
MATNNINLKCVQINLNTCKASTSHLSQFILENNIDIAFIQEPHVYKSQICGLNKFSLFYDKTVVNPKSAILLSNICIKAIFIQSFSSNILTVVKYYFNHKSIILLSAYCSPNSDINTFQIELDNISIAIQTLKSYYTVLCIH